MREPAAWGVAHVSQFDLLARHVKKDWETLRVSGVPLARFDAVR